MSSRSQASANPTLTNYATGVAQDTTKALAEFIAPTVEVPSTLGQFKKFDDKNAFQVYDTARAMGGSATRIEFAASDAHYDCKPQALEITIDDMERDAAGDADPIRLDESKVKTLVTTSQVSHEAKVIATTVDAVTPEADLGVYSDASVDPVKEIDGVIQKIVADTGMMPNRMVLGLSAWAIIKNHPKVIARQPGAANIGVTFQQFAAMLLNPAIEIRVGIISKDTAKFGKAANKVEIIGAKLLIFIGSDSPTQYDPSFAKTFTGKRGGVTAVRTYREEPFNDVHLVDWSEDIEIVSTISGRVIALS